jgi:AcrR family transcriptional regulator
MMNRMTRTYRKAKRAVAEEATRERIVRATMALHLEKGVATTSYADVAERAGVGAATVYRHFPTASALIDACGANFWQAIDPPRPEDAAAVFSGCHGRAARLERLVQELDAFYARAAAPLWSAVRDRDRIPELALFLKNVRAGVVALVAAALDDDPKASQVRIAAAVADFGVWRALADTGVEREERIRIATAMIAAALSAHDPGASSPGGQPDRRSVGRRND